MKEEKLTFDIDSYCVKCKDKRTMVEGVIKTSDSGRRIAVGKCLACGTKVNRILGKTTDVVEFKIIKEEPKYRIKVTDNFNGACPCKYRWSAEHSLSGVYWSDFESGCALTFRTAKWAATRRVKRKIKGLANRKEWIKEF